MIDIHMHLLYGVDDGAKNLEESIEMLKDAKQQGIEKCILTPHYRYGMFPYDKTKIDENFRVFERPFLFAKFHYRLYRCWFFCIQDDSYFLSRRNNSAHQGRLDI